VPASHTLCGTRQESTHFSDCEAAAANSQGARGRPLPPSLHRLRAASFTTAVGNGKMPNAFGGQLPLKRRGESATGNRRNRPRTKRTSNAVLGVFSFFHGCRSQAARAKHWRRCWLTLAPGPAVDFRRGSSQSDGFAGAVDGKVEQAVNIHQSEYVLYCRIHPTQSVTRPGLPNRNNRRGS